MKTGQTINLRLMTVRNETETIVVQNAFLSFKKNRANCARSLKKSHRVNFGFRYDFRYNALSCFEASVAM